MENGKNSLLAARYEALFDHGRRKSKGRLSEITRILLCVIPAVATLSFGAVETWALGLLAILVSLIALAWIAEAFFAGRLRISNEWIQLPILCLILIGFVQLLPLSFRDIPADLLNASPSRALTLDPYATRFALVELVILLIFFGSALVVFNTRDRVRAAVLFVIIFGGIMAFFGTIQRLANVEGIFGVRPSPQAIPFATFINQHHFAAFMEMTLGLTLGLRFGTSTKKDKQLLLSTAAVLMGIAAIMTSSRGGMLSLIGVILFVLAVNIARKRAKVKSDELAEFETMRTNVALIGGSVALILILVGAVFLLGGDQELLRGVGFTSQDDISSGRVHFWETTLKMIWDYPILGVGLNAFGTAYPQYDSWNGALRVENAHNDYLQILAEAGIPGFLAAVFFIFLLFKNGLATIGHTADRLRRDIAVGSLAGCFGVLIHSFFDFPLRTTSNAFFFLLLAAFAIRRHLGRTAH
jgi:O-antigen ligase